MGRLFKNKKIQIFSIWYVCLVLIAGSVATVTYVKEINREQIIYKDNLRGSIQNLTNYLGQGLIAAVNSSNSIFLSRWYTKYRNSADIYSPEFDGLKRMEVTDDIYSKVIALSYISDILVITPYRKTVICKNGWFSIDDYHTIYGAVKINLMDASMPLISPDSDSICIITLQDTTSRLIQGTICIFIDKKLFAGTLQQFLPENVAYVKAEVFGQTLFESGVLEKDHTVNTSSLNWPNFSITTGSLSYRNSLMRERTKTYVLVMTIVLLAGAILSAFITMIVLNPLSQMIKNFGGNFRKLDDPYRFISEYVEGYSEKNARLFVEKENLNNSMNCFLSLMRNEILFSMMTNPYYDFNDDYTLTTIPWINDGYPYALALLESEFQEKTGELSSSVLNDFTELALRFCTFTIFNNDLCILFWFKDIASAKTQQEQIKKRLVENMKDSYHISVSDILLDPKEMGESYLKQKSDIDSLKQSQYYLPLSFQIELANMLQQSEEEKCMEYLYNSQGKYNTDAVMQLLTRIALKHDIGFITMDQYKKYKEENDEDKKWYALIGFAKRLCEAINKIKSTSINETAEIIRRYIDENYFDANLCINGLSDLFSMHRSLVSKILKKHLGVTFSDYLQSLRIEKAMKMLEDVDLDMNISEIGETVGYINYITFKRAFKRCRGVYPREFRDQHME